jgi:hypothetical protein
VTIELRCVLQHWYELRPNGERVGDANAKRLIAIRTLNTLARRRGVDGLHGDILSSIKGEQADSEVHLPVGAGLFADDVRIETYVRKGLHHQHQDYRIAATYACLFFLSRSEEMASILSERVVLAEGGQLIVLASRDALTIWSEVRSGGKCSRCRVKSPESLFDWVPDRALPRNDAPGAVTSRR